MANALLLLGCGVGGTGEAPTSNWILITGFWRSDGVWEADATWPA
jgi:hypothetical protein